jgi:hypothetical protein
MSATIARQGGQVKLEQSHMHLVLTMGKIAKAGFSCVTVKETQNPMKRPRTEVREKMKRGDE